MKLSVRILRYLPVVCAALPGIATAGNAAPVVDPASENIIQRLESIERKLDNQSLFDLYNQVQSLESEVQKLRGELETQRHLLNEMTQRQKDLYADIDDRLQKLETAETDDGADHVIDDRIETDTETTVDSSSVSGEVDDSDIREQDAAADSVTADSADARKAYDDAFSLLKNGNYTEATTAFEQYLDNYPDSDLTDNASYWLGEAYYVNRDFEKAIGAYQQLVEDFPDSQKVPHALLKIGYSQQELGNREKAMKTLQDLRSQYPDTTAASLARERLQQMQSAGT